MDYISHWMIAPNVIESREYQQNISKTSSQKNTLVILPTALGKTIIALLTAVKRLDMYPWAKILFMAPTRPLVLQHYKTFSDFLIYDENKVCVVTGRNAPRERIMLWEQSQIIFSTPQVIKNDLEEGRYDLSEVALIIFDEAHRARQNYAYTKIAANYIKNNTDPLILALTASPGKNKQRIQEICNHLFIEAIEFRTEKDPDVEEYINPIHIEWFKLKLPREYFGIKNQLESLLHKFLKRLHYMKFFLYKPIQYISKMDLINLGNKLRSQIQAYPNSNKNYYYSVLSIQAAAVSLRHALELLTTQDIETFLNFLNKIERNSDEGRNKFSKKIANDPKFQKLKAMTQLYATVDHTKLNHLRDIIIEELKTNENSKIIVFTQFRDTASKIVDKLQILPSVSPIRFVGQSSKEDDIGLTQGEQAEILEEFSYGKYNTLVATCIAEEGLDIPSVELVVFYEPIPSEIRYIQRRGRTGRKKFGKVKILIAEKTLDEAFFYASLKREKEMKAIVSRLEKDLAIKINRIPLKKPEKPSITNNTSEVKKNYKTSKKKELKRKSVNYDPRNFSLEIEKGKVKLLSNNKVNKLMVKKCRKSTQLLTNYKPIKTKGLSNAVKWVIRRASECDNGDGINIEEFLKIS
ncbi:MAG: DEAD/DEAH box helicase, partial [Candidatus Hodarchaeota archaeon]